MTSWPAANNPYDNMKNNKLRQKYTLDHMLDNGAISEQEYNEALNYELKITGDITYTNSTIYEDETKDQGPTSYFMDAAINQTIQIIAPQDFMTADLLHIPLLTEVCRRRSRRKCRSKVISPPMK